MNKSTTEANFITAFWQLYSLKPIEKISIQALCKLAGYNRSTFYTHYKNIYDLLDEAVESLITRLDQTLFNLQDLHILLDQKVITRLFFTIFKSKNTYISLLMRQQHLYILEDKIKARLLMIIKSQLTGQNEKEEDLRLEYAIEYQFSAVFGVFAH